MRQDAAHVLLGNAVIDRACGWQPAARFYLLNIPQLCDLCNGLTCHLGVRLTPGDRHLDAWVDLPQVQRA